MKPFTPHMWTVPSDSALDVGEIPINGVQLPCGWNRDNLSTCLSTGNWGYKENHILEEGKASVHIWGYPKSLMVDKSTTCPHPEALIHK
jgi:hypothetical protein